MVNINELSDRIYKQNKQVGWWDGKQCLYTKLMLDITEVAEATEGYRKDLNDDKLGHRMMEEVELADTMIRTLDLGGYLHTYVHHKCVNNLVATYRHQMHDFTVGRMQLEICTCITEWGKSMDSPLKSKHNALYTNLVCCIVAVAELRGFDLWGAVDEKLAFNATRADHTREERAKKHGKKI